MKKIIVLILALLILISTVSCINRNDEIPNRNDEIPNRNDETPFVPKMLEIANMPFITEYTVGESNKICLDGLVVLEYDKDMGPWDRAICWSKNDVKYDNSFYFIENRTDIQVAHNVDFDKCGEYTVTVKYIDIDISCDFSVFVVEDEASPVENEEEAILRAKRYVYSEYDASYYEHNVLGPSRYEIRAELEDGVWTVWWSAETNMSEYLVHGGGGPAVEINADTGEIISCSLQQ